MKDECRYIIRLRGQVKEDEINTSSPIHIQVKQTVSNETEFTLFTDQSGLLGLLRYLHGLGLTFLSIDRKELCEENKDVTQ
jgi:hypothetical protein